MSDARTPTYDQLSALCAQMASALEKGGPHIGKAGYLNIDQAGKLREEASAALTAYRTLSPDPQWQRVPEGCVVVPEKPTKPMLKAGCNEVSTLTHYGAECCWTGMIRARGEG